MPRKNDSIATVVDRTYQDSYYDLRQACVDAGEETKIHVDDLLDMICGSGDLGTWEEWEQVEHDVRAEIVRRCCPDSDGYIWL